VPAPAVLAQPDTGLREPSHSSEDQVSGSDTVLGTHRPQTAPRGPILVNSRGTRMDRHAATRRLQHPAETAGIQTARAHPQVLRHTYIRTMLDAGVDLRDVQIAARNADPRTTMRYDRARQNLERHPTDILAAFMASGRGRSGPAYRRSVCRQTPCFRNAGDDAASVYTDSPSALGVNYFVSTPKTTISFAYS
jgi:Phage integrase family